MPPSRGAHVEDIIQLVESLGGLHDARILGLLWQPVSRSLEIEIKDIHINFEGLPEYRGPTKAKFIFSGVSKFDLNVDLADTIYLYDWTFTKDGTPNCELHFAPGGKIVIACSHIECVREV